MRDRRKQKDDDLQLRLLEVTEDPAYGQRKATPSSAGVPCETGKVIDPEEKDVKFRSVTLH